MATPEGQDETRAQMYGQTLPDLPATERLADIWRELGRAQMSFNGPTPFEWREIEAFNVATDSQLTPCEASCLVDMSRVYCGEIGNRSPLRIAPMERDL